MHRRCAEGHGSGAPQCGGHRGPPPSGGAAHWRGGCRGPSHRTRCTRPPPCAHPATMWQGRHRGAPNTSQLPPTIAGIARACAPWPQAGTCGHLVGRAALGRGRRVLSHGVLWREPHGIVPAQGARSAPRSGPQREAWRSYGCWYRCGRGAFVRGSPAQLWCRRCALVLIVRRVLWHLLRRLAILLMAVPWPHTLTPWAGPSPGALGSNPNPNGS